MFAWAVRTIALGFCVALSVSGGLRDCSAQETRASERVVPRAPAVCSSRGDYSIEHYVVQPNDLLAMRMRGIYRVIGVEGSELLLEPLPGQSGLLPGIWRVPLGYSPIGNHNQIVVSEFDESTQTIRVSLEYKTKWHWWDFNF